MLAKAMAYELTSLNLPKLSGKALKGVAGALALSATRETLLPNMLKQGGVDALRGWDLHEEPTFRPTHPWRDNDSADLGWSVEMAAGRMDVYAKALDSEKVSKASGAIRELARVYREGTSDPVAVAQAFLANVARDKRHRFPINSVVALHEETLLRDATASKKRFEAGEPLSLLDGVPVAIKDEMDVEGYETTVGTSFLSKGATSSDATLVARLRALGALIVCKTNLHEIGINPTGYNRRFGLCRNPYNPARDPGGSSSGSAAAVAQGLVPLAIGADGGGSIRIPAAFCGVSGLKATYGRISEHGVFPLCWSVGHVGPIGRHAEDVALGYLAIAGGDPQDTCSLAQPALRKMPLPGDLKGLTCGVYREWFEHADKEIVRLCKERVKELESYGVRVVEIEVPGLNEMRIAHSVTILSEMASAMQNHESSLSTHAPSVQISLRLGRSFTSRDYVRAQQVRTEAIKTFNKIFSEVDVLITPATATAAPPIPEGADACGWSDLSSVIEAMRYVVPGNLVGLPAMSVNVGYTRSGMPVGIQTMAAPWRDDLVLGVSSVLEAREAFRLPARHCEQKFA